MVRRSIPNYALYGEKPQPSWSNSFNFEWIPERSGPYNFEIQPHTHNVLVHLLYVSQGSAEVLLDSEKRTAHAPALVLVPAGTVHGWHFSRNVNGPVVTAAQSPLESLAAVLMPELRQVLRKPTVIALEDSPRHADALMPLFHAVEREYRTHASGHVAAGMSLLTALLVQIARIASACKPAAAPASSRKAVQIERFRALVDKKFNVHAPVDFYAGELGVTPGHLTRLCQEVLGMSSRDVINARVVHEAQRNLVYTSASVKQLATALGFDDEAYFSRFFRKHTGQTPMAFRAKALTEMARSGLDVARG